jgi:hypothetical protein
MYDSILWEWYQHNRIGEAQSSADRARSDVNTVERELRRNVDQLMLINMAMWSILEEKLGVSEAELADRLREIDLRDGKLDGKLAREGLECPRCSRVMSVRHQKCLYCGEASLSPRVFS